MFDLKTNADFKKIVTSGKHESKSEIRDRCLEASRKRHGPPPLGRYASSRAYGKDAIAALRAIEGREMGDVDGIA